MYETRSDFPITLVFPDETIEGIITIEYGYDTPEELMERTKNLITRFLEPIIVVSKKLEVEI